MGQTKFGLRGVGTGKNTNPGHQKRRIRPPLKNPTMENLLERELTMLVSNNEPLVRQTDGRHVVPTITNSSLSTVPASFGA